MTSAFEVNPEQLLATAREASSRADNMAGLVKSMNTDIDFVRQAWRGATGDEFRITLDKADTQMDGLIQALLRVAQEVKQSAEAFLSQEGGSRTAMANASQANNVALSGPLNFA